MSVEMVITKKANAGGKSFEEKRTLEGTSLALTEFSVPAAKDGSLTTRTDANTGVITFEAAHGLATSDVVDVYWDGGRRFGMTCTVAALLVTVDGGTGDDLPVTSTDMAVMKPVTKALHFVGTDAIGIAVSSAKRGKIVLAGSDHTADYTFEVGDAGADNWSEGDNLANPVDGDTIAEVQFSHGHIGGAVTMRASALV